MFRSRAFRFSLSLAALAVTSFAVAPAPPVCAQDEEEEPGEEGDDPHEGAEAPPAEKPTMDGAIEVADGRRTLAIQVPKSWEAPKEFKPSGTRVALFFGRVTQGAPGSVELVVDTTHARASLAQSNWAADGTPLPAESRSGPGWVEGAAEFPGRRQRLVVWQRAVEKDGVVFVARIGTYANARDEARPLVQQMLDTFHVVKPPAPREPPAGVTSKKAGEFDLWTDSDDKSKPAKVAEFAAESRGFLAKALKGKPYDTARPVVQAFQAGTLYIDATGAVGGDPPEYAAFVPATRAVAAQMFRMDHQDFPGKVRDAAAQQYLSQYFGGTPPTWVDRGLRWYATIALEAGGKPEKVDPYRQEGARAAVAAGKIRLDDWLSGSTSAPVPDENAAGYEAWAWHWFLRHGPGKKYGKQYAAYLDALRQTGDTAAARKAWEGVDFAAMDKEFRDWGSRWK